MYPNTLALARRLDKAVVAYDLEHTGSAGAQRRITEFGAMRVTPDGVVTSYSSLVKPPEGTEFNHFVCRLTGIYPHTVSGAAGWSRVLEEFVIPNRNSVWVGFNSRGSDTPLVYKESLLLGHELAPFTQIDLMRVGKLEGGLARRLELLVPGFDTSGTHRAPKDALMTLGLLEAQLPTITELELQNQLAPPPPNSLAGLRQAPRHKAAILERRKLDVSLFLVAEGVRRSGMPWSDDEIVWVCRMYRSKKKTVEELAVLNGRTAFAVAHALHKEGLVSLEGCQAFMK